MKILRLLILLFLFAFSSCSDKLITMVNTRPFLQDWQFCESGKNEWLPATVPGLVQTDLLRNKKIEKPLFNENELKLQWISETDWQYKARFEVTDSLLKYKVVDFIFKGIDTYATVLLNDSVLVRTDNMFREWRINSRRFLKRGSNEIKIILHAPSRMVANEIMKLPYKLPMSNDGGDVKYCSFVRKAPYQFGWDWSPRFLTMGIWQPVYISAHDGVYISGLQIKTIELADTCAWLSGYVTINSQYDLPNTAITILDGFRQFRLKKGETTTQVKFKILNPELWWPNGYGKQPLYNVTAKLFVNGYQVDTVSDRFGIRTVELFQDEDEWGTSFYFRINGLPVFMKGANYVPQSNFLTDVTNEDYQKIVYDVKNVGMNMLRVWGGGIYENEIFYDLCDENGILVWQDFMFAGSMYPGDSVFLKNVEKELQYQVSRLRNHPCIALWCGNNEIDVAWKNWGWQKEYKLSAQDSAQISSNYIALFNEKIPAWLNVWDNTRAYIPSSPISNWGNHENFRTGNMHYWGVWHGEDQVDSFRAFVPRFMTEYGMQSFPSWNTLKQNTSDERVTLGSEFIRQRQKSYKGNRVLIDYIEHQFGPVKNAEALCYLSQLHQAEAMRIAIESHRKEARYCMGSLYWQLNDVWDGASWSTREHNGTWKAAHYHLKRLYAPDILIPETVNDTFNLYLQTDNTDGIRGELKIEVLDFKGRNLGSYWQPAATGYLVSNLVFRMPLSALLRGNDKTAFFLKAQLFQDEKEKAKTIHYFVSPKELKLGTPDINNEIIDVPGGAEIKLFSLTLVKGVMLEFENVKGEFSENYFDLLPGEEKVVKFISEKSEMVEKKIKLKYYLQN